MEHRQEESLGPEDIASIQREGLAEAVDYACSSSPFYRDLLARWGLRPRDISTPDGLTRFPVTSKGDVSERNRDFLAVPESKVLDVVTTSGTTGKPTMWFLTGRDLERLALNEYLSFKVAGVGAEDVAFLSVTLDRCFVAGLAYYEGLKAVGAAVVRLGPASPAMHLDLMEELEPTAVVSVPSFLRRIAGCAAEQERELGRTVRRAVCIGEPVRDRELVLSPVGRGIEASWGARVHSTYASTEVLSTFCECEAGAGGHGHPELIFVEILDDDGNRLPPGEVGEVVATPLRVEGMPLLRFRTGDLSFLIEGGCACGRNTPRLGPILGRKGQMLKIKGTTVFPSAVRRALDALPAVASYVMVVTSDGALSDRLEVLVSSKGDGDQALEEAHERLQGELKVAPDVRLATIEEIESLQCPPGSRKRRLFIDNRR
ncbi:MAG: phenylacetate--CoA ligase family protein [Planctomycetota bacterium]|jgi:phenylacetate-CoA ligase